LYTILKDIDTEASTKTEIVSNQSSVLLSSNKSSAVQHLQCNQAIEQLVFKQLNTLDQASIKPIKKRKSKDKKRHKRKLKPETKKKSFILLH